MIRRYHYIARTEAGSQFETVIEENNQDTANVQAKIEVERWLADEGEPVERLQQFDLVFTEPAE